MNSSISHLFQSFSFIARRDIFREKRSSSPFSPSEEIASTRVALLPWVTPLGIRNLRRRPVCPIVEFKCRGGVNARYRKSSLISYCKVYMCINSCLAHFTQNNSSLLCRSFVYSAFDPLPALAAPNTCFVFFDELQIPSIYFPPTHLSEMWAIRAKPACHKHVASAYRVSECGRCEYDLG